MKSSSYMNYKEAWEQEIQHAIHKREEEGDSVADEEFIIDNDFPEVKNEHFFSSKHPPIKEVVDRIALQIKSAQSISEVMRIIEIMEQYSTISSSKLEELRGAHCVHSGLNWKDVPVAWEWVKLVKMAKDKVMAFIHKEEAKPDSAMMFDQTVYEFLNEPTSRIYAFFHWKTNKAKVYARACKHIEEHGADHEDQHQLLAR